MTSLLLVLATSLAADTVTMDLRTWRALQPPEPEAPLHLTTAVLDRDLRLRPVSDAWRIDATWTVDVIEAVDLHLAGPEVLVLDLTVDGGPATASAEEDGLRVLLGPGRHTVTLAGEAPRAVDGSTLALLPATRGSLRLPAGWDVRADGPVAAVGDRWVTGAPTLTLIPAPVRADAGPLALGRVALGITVGDGHAQVLGRVAWLARRGRLETVRLRVPGAPTVLSVTGPDVAEVTRIGDLVTVALHRPAERVDLSLSWSVPLPAGDLATLAWPEVQPLDAFRVEHALELARDTAAAVLPQGSGRAVLPEDLPPWAQGLVRGEPVAARRGEVAGGVDVVRAVPAEQPPLWVDVASWVVALTDEGRSLLQGSLTVRNERAAWLRLVLPPDHRLVAVAVAGRPTAISPDGGGWRVPLPRSVETVGGFVSFPVDVTVLGAGEAWDRAQEARVPLPVIGAPVAVRRVTVNLPPGWRPRAEVGVGGVVEDFTEGEELAYGFGVVDEARAHELFQGALQDWQSNRFEEAQAKIDALRGLGADHGNVELLQGNLDLVAGKAVEGDEAVVRKVKAEVRARSAGAYREQEERLREAKVADARGDAAAAARAYAQVVETARQLDALEETGRQAVVAAQSSRRQAELEELLPGAPAPEVGTEEPAPTLRFSEVTPIDFESVDVDGSLVEPSGALMMDAGGVEGGVVGGVVGGALGGVGASMAGAAGNENAYTLDGAIVDEAADVIPTGRSYQMAAPDTVSGRHAKRMRRRGTSGDAAAPPPPPSSVDVDADGFERLDVSAAGVSAVVPVLGATVRYQHVLVDPDDPAVLRLPTRPTRRSR